MQFHVKPIHPSVLLISILGIFAIESGTAFFGRQMGLHPMLTTGLARIVETILFLGALSTWDQGVAAIGLAHNQIGRGLARGLLWTIYFGLASALACAVLFLLLRINPLNMIKAPLPTGPIDRGLFFLVGGLVAPIAEEVFFRGIVYGVLRRWGVATALLGSACLFVLAHVVYSGLPITQIVGGLVFAISYELEGSVLVPIMIHAIGNTAIFTVSALIF